MEKAVYKGRLIEYYSSIEEMPINVFQAFTRYSLIDAGVGGDLNSIDAHLVQLSRYNQAGDNKKFQTELQNLRQNLAFVVSGLSPKMMAFGAIIAKVNGRPTEDLSDEGIKSLLNDLGKWGLPYGLVLNVLDNVKKKCSQKWASISRRAQQTAGKKSFSGH